MQLEYFNGDYSRTGSGITSIPTGSTTYYNGNVTGMSWQSNKPASVVSAFPGIQVPTMYSYSYDATYQYNQSVWGTPTYSPVGSFAAGATFGEKGITYDPNGNITALQRTNSAGTLSDNFTKYSYQANTNKLTSVGTTATPTAYASYSYDEIGRLKSELQTGTTAPKYYLQYDVTGKVMAMYSDAAMTAPTPAQAEVPMYASERLGTYMKAGGSYVYEIRDNVGSVRVALNRTKVSGQADVYTYNDYYPYGSIARSCGTTYRYDYQGAYAEKDPVTGLNNFQLRMYDSKIGRWLSTDPAGQHASPYEGMGNNPVAKGDPTGGEDVNSPIYDRVTGEFLGVDDQGFTGDLLYMDKSVYNLLSNSGGIKIAHAFAETMAEKPSFSSINNSPLIYVFSGITLQALSNSYTDVLAKSGFDVSQLLNGKVSINYHDYNRGIAGNYNNGIDSPTDNATTSVDKRPITVTAQWSTVAAAHDYVKDAAGNEQLTILYTTVENIQNGLGVHELQYHGIKNLRNADHLEIFEAQLRAGSWPGTTNAFKNFILDHYNEIKR